MEGVDYAWDRPNLAQLVAAGKQFVCRYLAYLPNGKVLSPGEREALHAAGLSIVLNWEQAAGDMLKGRAKGVEHATEALRQANALGAPSSVPIYFSCDVNITNVTSMVAVQEYLIGCASVLGRERVGVYGQHSVIEWMVPNYVNWGWQTYAWSGGKVSNRAHIMQYRNGVQLAGADLDLNKTLRDDIGAWEENTVAYEPFGPPKRDVAGRNVDTMVADLWGYLLLGRSPWGDPKEPLTTKGVGAVLADILSHDTAVTLSDAQITSLAQLIAEHQDATQHDEMTTAAVETALRNVLKKGTDDDA